MPRAPEVWTCEVCGTRAHGSGRYGVWPPSGWTGVDGQVLAGRCPAHPPTHADTAPEGDAGWRLFPGGG